MTELEKYLYCFAVNNIEELHGRGNFDLKGNLNDDEIKVYVASLKILLLEAYEFGVHNEHKKLTGEDISQYRTYDIILNDKIFTEDFATILLEEKK